MKKLIIATASASPAQRNAITKYLKAARVGYWHWLPDLWLVVPNSPELTAASMRETIKKVAPGLTTLVFEFDHSPGGIHWAGFCPPAWSEWLRKYWSS